MQRRDTPNCPSTRREHVHGAVAQREWYCLLDKRCHERWTWKRPTRSAQAMDRKGRQGRGLCVGRRRGDLIAPAIGGTTRALERRSLLAGPVCGLALVEGFDDGRLLAPLRVFDRHEPPGFDVSSHLKGRDHSPRLSGFCFPFRHVRSPQKSVLTMPRGTTVPLGKIPGNLSTKDASSPGVGLTCRGRGGVTETAGRGGVLAKGHRSQLKGLPT